MLDGVHIYYNNTNEDTTEIESCGSRGVREHNCELHTQWRTYVIITPLGHRKERSQLASERRGYVITFTVKSGLFNVNCRSASTHMAGWQIIQA